MTRVKICGVTNKEDALIAAEAGADAVGVVVEIPVKTPRRITVEKAKEILSSVPVFVSTVTVIMPRTIEDAVRIVHELRPDVIQLQGYESHEFVSEIKKFLGVRIIKVIHIEEDRFNERNLDEIAGEIRGYENAGVCGVVLDTKTESGAGGTGRVHNWELSKKINEKINLPLILAGGLNPGNVKKAVEMVEPYAVDVSSGVESAVGKKDNEKVKRFIEGAKSV
ncbi:MAG: hypothetical protein A7316_10615 [Candidatus Altiarchaeales archaeon WOR_SM1_86-2]|nr:MAG: hypothetical protein A7316_10615 [Candidatus Altiarchaeales archaeon WOR_SM1_86-2]ODS38299.1 MAG: hypothetical protein A7315_12610 [Candidatus Altiarchaeales archaeon WOR_SM1_79]